MALTANSIVPGSTQVGTATGWLNNGLPVSGPAADFTSVNPVLSLGQVGVESNTGKVKVGNGTSAWTALVYINPVDLTGLLSTVAELNHVDGVTAPIQGQIDTLTAAVAALGTSGGGSVGASNVGVDNNLGSLWDGAANVQAALEYGADNYLDKADVAAPASASTMAATDVFVIASSGSYRTIEKQLVVGTLRVATATTTLAATDNRGKLVIDSTSPVTVTIDTNANVAFPAPGWSEVSRVNTGAVTIAAAAGVTINGANGGTVTIADRYGAVDLTQISPNAWIARGVTASAPVDSTPPTLSSTTPADNATDVVISASPTATFSEAIQRGTGNILLRTNNGGWSTVATYDAATSPNLSISGSVLTIDPSADLVNGREYAIQIAAGAIRDLAGNNFAGITNDTTWSFTTVAAAPTGPVVVAAAGVTIASQVSAGSSPQVVSLPTLQQDDKVFIFSCCDSSQSSMIPSGYSGYYNATSVVNPSRYVYYKAMGAVPDTSISVPRVFDRPQAFGYLVLRGAASLTDLDEGSFIGTAATGASGSPDAPAKTQTNANVVRIIAGFLDDDDVTMTAPAGWTLGFTANGNVGSVDGCSLIVCYQAAGGSAGASVNPAAFTGGDDEWAAVHFAQH